MSKKINVYQFAIKTLCPQTAVGAELSVSAASSYSVATSASCVDTDSGGHSEINTYATSSYVVTPHATEIDTAGSVDLSVSATSSYTVTALAIDVNITNGGASEYSVEAASSYVVSALGAPTFTTLILRPFLATNATGNTAAQYGCPFIPGTNPIGAAVPGQAIPDNPYSTFFVNDSSATPTLYYSAAMTKNTNLVVNQYAQAFFFTAEGMTPDQIASVSPIPSDASIVSVTLSAYVFCQSDDEFGSPPVSLLFAAYANVGTYLGNLSAGIAYGPELPVGPPWPAYPGGSWQTVSWDMPVNPVGLANPVSKELLSVPTPWTPQQFSQYDFGCMAFGVVTLAGLGNVYLQYTPVIAQLWLTINYIPSRTAWYVSAESSMVMSASTGWAPVEADVSAQSSIVMSADAGWPLTSNTYKYVNANSKYILSQAPVLEANLGRSVYALTRFIVTHWASETVYGGTQVNAATIYVMSHQVTWGGPHEAYASSSVVFTGVAGLQLNHVLVVSGYNTLKMSVGLAQNVEHVVSANSRAVLTAITSSGRDIYVYATTSVGFYAGTGGEGGEYGEAEGASLYWCTAMSSASVSPTVPPNPYVVSTVVMQSRADAQVQLSGGATVPGGDTEQGLRTLLFQGLSDFPLSFAESSDGTLLMANGIDPMVRWDGMAPVAINAGVAAPWSPVGIYPLGAGQITGSRWAYQRFINVFGLTSDPSPIGARVDCGSSGVIASAAYDLSGFVTVNSPGHGLVSGEQVVISGVQGIAINGTFGVIVVDADNFTLVGITLNTGSLVVPGSWTSGASSVRYSAEVPTDTSVVRRQILRNLDGDTSCFYVDIDTTDMDSISFTSTMLDEQLSAQEPMPISYDDGMPAARRYGYPPSHKAVLATHLGRIFASVDQPYAEGNVFVALGSQLVQGVGTSWTSSMAGRSLYCQGATSPQIISSVMPSIQMLTLQAGYSGPSSQFATYAIRPANSERRLVYYSEPNEPESWPAWNAFAVPETGAEITGLMVMKSYLYILETRNIHSFTFKSDPGRDGFIFPKINRGCINNRCWVIVEGKAYMLDEAGIHVFDGDASQAISSKIHNIFNDPTYPYQVDWTSDPLLWHCVADPVNELIRWFVDFIGQGELTYAICYDYRRDRWWLEQYAEGVYSSTLTTIGYRRAIGGTTGRRVIVLGEDTLDGIASDTPGVLSGAVLVATSTSLQIAAVTPGFPESLAGVPVVITSGAGRGQQAIICDSTTNVLTLSQPLDVVPSPGDTFQIGGIPWTWRGGWLPYVDDESDNARDVGVVFQPTSMPGSLAFRLYFDYSVIPQNWGVSKSLDGISTISGTPEVTINTQTVRGYAIQRMQSRRERYSMSNYFVSLELTGVQACDTARIYEVIMDGCEPRGSGEE